MTVGFARGMWETLMNGRDARGDVECVGRGKVLNGLGGGSVGAGRWIQKVEEL